VSWKLHANASGLLFFFFFFFFKAQTLQTAALYRRFSLRT
jgi:hypothetical protein